MAHNPIFGPDPAKPDSSASHSPASRSSEGGSDLAELAAKVAVHGGGRVSPELSADLALQIVLNQIVEQACLATGAGGAAIALERGGEWVCQASAGRIAPQLGARLDAEAGLSGACVKTRTTQRCDDAQNDPRADTEACRMLGVRSVIILPLLRGGELAGVFEVFSSLPSAFGERDEHTLEALSQRVLRNLERAAEPIPAAAKDPAIEQPPLMENPIAASGPISDGTFTAAATADDRGQGWVDRLPMQPAGESASSRGMNILTLVLGAAVLAYAVLLTVLVIQRLAGGKTPTRAHGTGAVSAPVGGADSRLVAGSGVPGAAASSVFPGGQSAGSSGAVPATSATGTGSAGTAHVGSTPPPAGSLLVYENGREVFRVSPAAGESAVQSTGIVEVSPEMAEGSLLHRVEPDYPEEARREQIEGPVVLDVRTGRDGSVEEVRLLAGRKVLADSAIAAVKQWRFRPKVVNGKPAEIQTRVTLNFRLPQ